MTSGEAVHFDETSSRDRHDHKLCDSIADRDRIRRRAVRIEKRHSDLTAIASINCAGAVDDRYAVFGSEPAAGHNKCDVTVGHRYRDTGADGGTFTRCELDGLGRVQVGPSISRVRVCGKLWGNDENVDAIGHESRLVQNLGRPERWSNRAMTTYRERLWPSLWLYISTLLVIPAALLVFLPINKTAGPIVGIALYAGVVISLLLGSPVVRVTDEALLAGRATLPIRIMGAVTAFHGDAARDERGPRLDARAWLLIRGWIAPVVKIELDDPDDPAPYWIVSTRHPEAVVAAIESARARLSNN